MRACQHCGAELPADAHPRRKYCPEGDCTAEAERRIRAESFRRTYGRAARKPPRLDRCLTLREVRQANLRASMAWRKQDPRTAGLLDRERAARGITPTMEA